MAIATTETDKQHLQQLHKLKTLLDGIQQELDDEIRRAIQDGTKFTDMARVLDKSEAAVRQRANRRGWHDAGSRRSR